MKDIRIPLYMSLIILFCYGCQDDVNLDPDIPGFVYAGGETTIFDATSLAYATPAPNLTPINFEKHLEGDLTFEQIFVTSPADVNPGLGPVFNNNSCVSCHIRNGRSEPSLDGDDLSGFLIRLSVPGSNSVGGPKPAPYFGGQLQNRAIYGTEREANFYAVEEEKLITFADGTTRIIYKPNYFISEPYRPLPDDLMMSPRVAPSVFGLGLLESIAEEDILALADINDTDDDGISGKPNMVWSIDQQKHTLGRMGWKAENPSSRQQSADAYHQDMGITSSLFPVESCDGQPNCEDDGLADIDDETLDATTFYFQTLAVPAMRNYNDPVVLRGRDLFEELECHLCHIPKHVTSQGIIPELSNQTIFPYTDMLLHDMGDDLSDNRPSYEAEGNEWRTAPLWGIGLLEVVNGHSRLLHDGRARNIEDAILWHGGEAEDSQKAYLELAKNDRDALLEFIRAI